MTDADHTPSPATDDPMAAISDEAIRVAEDVWSEDEPTSAEYELTERILTAARTSPATDGLREAVEALAAEWQENARKNEHAGHGAWSMWQRRSNDLRAVLAAHPAPPSETATEDEAREQARINARGNVLSALMLGGFAAKAGQIRAVVMPVIYAILDGNTDPLPLTAPPVSSVEETQP